jgi:hypothetical protein
MEIRLRFVLQGNLSNGIFIAENYHEIIRKIKSNVNIHEFVIEMPDYIIGDTPMNIIEIIKR